jgi:sensor histidine kinase regulating citrate/malate metabolism
MAEKSGRSAASRVFIALVGFVVAVAVLTAGLLLLEGQRSARAEAERLTQAVAHTLARTPEIAAALSTDAASESLQPLAEDVMAGAEVDFVTIMLPDGTRVTHRDPAEIGKQYLGTMPEDARALTEEFEGTLGRSIRTIVPIESQGDLVGWVSVGVTVESIAASVVPRVLVALGIGAAVVAAGFAGALLARRATRSVAGDLPAGAVRDTLASAESMRTLGEALRAQTHEHGNRMHAAVSLLELGRTREAIGILTESAAQSQALVDQVAARTEGDPTVGALLLGKSSQALERGVEWTADIAADAPRSLLAPIDQVALVGNLIDNALDAAGAGPEPRWVRVAMARTPAGELLLTVSDSGDGVPEELRERIFERGFSTKPADAVGRGVGLALVRAVVDDVGGSITLDEGAPTTFRVVLPTEASR